MKKQTERSRVESMTEVFDDKRSEIENNHRREVTQRQNDYDIELRRLIDAHRQLDEDHVKEVTGFQNTIRRLGITNEHLQSVVNQQLLDIKRLKDNSELQKELDAEQLKYTTLYINHENLSNQHQKQQMKIKV